MATRSRVVFLPGAAVLRVPEIYAGQPGGPETGDPVVEIEALAVDHPDRWPGVLALQHVRDGRRPAGVSVVIPHRGGGDTNIAVLIGQGLAGKRIAMKMRVRE